MQGVSRKVLAHAAVWASCIAALPAGAQEASYERPVHAASGTAVDEPGGAEMVGDALVGRPLLIATTVVGAATFLVSLPFSLAGRNVGAAADKLVGGPFRATFIRCLGCTRPAQSFTHSSQKRSYGEAYDAY